MNCGVRRAVLETAYRALTQSNRCYLSFNTSFKSSNSLLFYAASSALVVAPCLRRNLPRKGLLLFIDWLINVLIRPMPLLLAGGSYFETWPTERSVCRLEEHASRFTASILRYIEDYYQQVACGDNAPLLRKM